MKAQKLNQFVVAVLVLTTLFASCGGESDKIDCKKYADTVATRAYQDYQKTYERRKGFVDAMTGRPVIVEDPATRRAAVYKKALADCREENIWRGH